MSEITKQIQFLCDEKNLDYDVVLEALQSALGAAYRKDFGNRQQNIQVIFDPETGDMKVWDEKEVSEDIDEETLEKSQEELNRRREEAKKEGRELTEEEMNDLVRFNPKNQIMLSEAKEIKKDAKVGDILKINLEVGGEFGRMAAQTAKQVIIQKLREAERAGVFEDFKSQENGIVQGVIQRRDRGGAIIIDLGKITGILPQNEQIRREHYKLGSKMRFFVVSVQMGGRGPEIILSRRDKKMVEVTFEQEIPEIAGGEVIIKGIARDAGFRSKVAVWTENESIDPIGSCIGQRGSRITTIIDELGGEKVDIIQYSDDAIAYIKNSLSPAKIGDVELNEKDKEAKAKVASDQFSLAIGRDGQNVRLAAELTGWKISVEDLGGEQVVSSEGESENLSASEETVDSDVSKENVEVEKVKSPKSAEKSDSDVSKEKKVKKTKTKTKAKKKDYDNEEIKEKKKTKTKKKEAHSA